MQVSHDIRNQSDHLARVTAWRIAFFMDPMISGTSTSPSTMVLRRSWACSGSGVLLRDWAPSPSKNRTIRTFPCKPEQMHAQPYIYMRLEAVERACTNSTRSRQTDAWQNAPLVAHLQLLLLYRRQTPTSCCHPPSATISAECTGKPLAGKS